MATMWDHEEDLKCTDGCVKWWPSFCVVAKKKTRRRQSGTSGSAEEVHPMCISLKYITGYLEKDRWYFV